jgi:hypothetical protein
MIASFRAPTAHHSRTSFVAAHARPTTLANRPPSDELKFRGFGWSPSEGAWQRHLNDAGKWAEMRGRISQQTAKNQSSGQRQQISYMQRPTRKLARRCNDRRQDREIDQTTSGVRRMNELINCANGAWLWFYKVAPIYPVLATAVVAAGIVAVVAWYEHRKESVK